MTPQRKPTDLDISEILIKTNSEEWQKSIASRLSSIKSFLAQDEWTAGIDPFLRAIIGTQLKRLMKEGGNVDYVRGFYAALEMILALPVSVEFQLAQEGKKDKVSPAGDAGY